jgi:hypothetical protein
MDLGRRDFLRIFSGAAGGIAVTATMAEAGMLAEFMDWLRRAPVWSLPVPLPVPLTIHHFLVEDLWADEYYKMTPEFTRFLLSGIRSRTPIDPIEYSHPSGGSLIISEV